MLRRQELAEVSTTELLRQREGFEVEFKANAAGFRGDVAVAFANSALGGSVLIGVAEDVDGEGRQTGRPLGLSLNERSRSQIVNVGVVLKPALVLQPYEVEVGGMPLIRLDIPPSANRPHCTGSGKYLTRIDGQNMPLEPIHLLRIFMDTHGHQFVSRLRSVLKGVESRAESIRGELNDSMEGVLSDIESMGHKLSESLEETLIRVDEAIELGEGNTSSIHDELMWLRKDIDRIESDNGNMYTAIAMLLEEHGLEEPPIANERLRWRTAFTEYYENKSVIRPSDARRVVYRELGRPRHLGKAAISDILDEVTKSVREGRR